MRRKRNSSISNVSNINKKNKHVDENKQISPISIESSCSNNKNNIINIIENLLNNDDLLEEKINKENIQKHITTIISDVDYIIKNTPDGNKQKVHELLEKLKNMKITNKNNRQSFGK
jgi:hypothetical protein